MTEIDKLLDAAVQDAGMEPPGLTDAELERVCRLAEAKRLRRKAWRRGLLLAAAAIAVSTACAAAFSVNDIFRGGLWERTASGGTGPVEKHSGQVERAGSVVGKSQTADGIKVTLQGVVGDDRMLALRFTLETADGSPLTDLLETGDLNNLLLGRPGEFDRMGIRVDGFHGAYGGAGPQRLDSGDNPARMEFLLQRNYGGNGVVGKQAAFYINGISEQLPGRKEKRLVSDGVWTIRFPLDFQETSMERATDWRVTREKGELRVSAVSWSALSFSMSGTTEEPPDDTGILDGLLEDTSLVMRDGSVIRVKKNSSASSCGELESGWSFTVYSPLPYVIDPADVAALNIGGAVCSLE